MKKFVFKTSLLLGALSFFFLSAEAKAPKVRYQKVSIKTNSANEILIDGELPTMEKGMFLIPRDQKPHIITVNREGYKSEQTVAIPYKSNGYTYPEEYVLGMKMIPLPEKSEGMKNLRVNEVAVDIKLNNNRMRRFKDYETYMRKSEKKESEPFESDEEEVKSENTIFSFSINSFLKDNGFIDTSDKVFKNGYLNNLIADATVQKYTFHLAPSHEYIDYGGMIYVDLSVEWQVKDIYGKVIHTYSTKAEADHHAYNQRDEIRSTVNSAITDALEKSLLEFMKTDEVKKALVDESQLNEEKGFSALSMAASTYASSLNDAVKASVTVKLEDQHGSGFIISDEGHLVTNFHVISDEGEIDEELKIITNDQDEYSVEVVRVSRIHDLALLKIKDFKGGIKPLKVDKSGEIEIASDIFAVGTPKAEDLNQTISKGIISGVRKTDQDYELIQIDASINSGNSGGAIVNNQAKVIGVVSSKLFGFGVEGVAFGIPAKDLIEHLKLAY